MFRKYNAVGTHPLDSHHYVLEVTQGGESSLFHQILVGGSGLPGVVKRRDVQDMLEESENQMAVVEEQGGYEFYQEHNLLQVHLKQGVRAPTSMHTLPPQTIAGLIRTLTLDLTLSLQQFMDHPHPRNHTATFHQIFLRNDINLTVMPFIEGSSLLYYDLTFDNQYPLTPSHQHGHSNHHRRLKDEGFHNEPQQVFRKYIMFVMVLISSHNLVEWWQKTRQLAAHKPNQQDLRSQLERFAMSESSEIRPIVKLMEKCVCREEQYNLNVLGKECELLIAKQQKLQELSPVPFESRDRVSNQSTKMKLKTSKSCIAINRSNLPRSNLSRHAMNLSTSFCKQGRLKYSKSQISLKKNLSNSKSRLKKGLKLLGLKESPKITVNAPSNPSTPKSPFKPKNSSSNFSFSKQGLRMMNTANSVWFGASRLDERENASRLRQFKKGNGLGSTGGSKVWPKRTSKQRESATGKTMDMVSQESMSKLNKMIVESKQSKSKKSVETADNNKSDKMAKSGGSDNASGGEWLKVDNRSFVRPDNISIVNAVSITYYEQSATAKPNPQSTAATEQAEVPGFERQERSTSTFIPQPAPKAKSGPKKEKSLKKKVSQSDEVEEVILPSKKSTNNISSCSKSGTSPKQKQANKSPETSEDLKKSMEGKTTKKKTKKVEGLLPKSQGALYVKHYQFLLQFIQSDLKYYSKLPHYNKYYYFINLAYYLTLLAHTDNITKESFTRLIKLLTDRQKRIPQTPRSRQSVTLNLNFEDVWVTGQKIKEFERTMQSHREEWTEQEWQPDESTQELLQMFYSITIECSSFFKEFLRQYYQYMQKNKPLLLQQQNFQLLLELNYLTATCCILMAQQAEYYRALSAGKLKDLQKVYSFRFQEREDEYFLDYRRRLKERNLMLTNCEDERKEIERWIENYL